MKQLKPGHSFLNYLQAITKETVNQLITYAGAYVGIGSFRPTNNGMFGRFEVQSIS